MRRASLLMLGLLVCSPVTGWAQSGYEFPAIAPHIPGIVIPPPPQPNDKIFSQPESSFTGQTYEYGEYRRYIYTYKDGRGNTYKGEMEIFPGGQTRQKGSWR